MRRVTGRSAPGAAAPAPGQRHHRRQPAARAGASRPRIRDSSSPTQVLDGIVLDPNVLDGPDPDNYVELVQESFCLACQTPEARFESHGGDLMHYAGDPMSDNIMPIETDHAPFLP